MNTAKKLLSVMLALAMVLGMAACGGNTETADLPPLPQHPLHLQLQRMLFSESCMLPKLPL